jgi:hypothetical protein
VLITSAGAPGGSTTTTTPADITQTSAVLGGNITSTGLTTITSRGVCYNDTGLPDINSNKLEVPGTSGTFSGTSAIKWLLYKLSKEYAGLVSLSQYFNRIIPAIGSGPLRVWPVEEVYSEENIKLVREINNGNFSKIPSDWRYLVSTFS